MKNQAKRFGAETVYDTVSEVELEGDVKTIKGLTNTYQRRPLFLLTEPILRP
jgi:thioredoxin reductase (NADPH)